MQLNLDFQIVPSECQKCSSIHPVVRGSVYDGDSPVGLYLISLHGHCEGGCFAQLAIAINDTVESKSRLSAVALNLFETEEQIEFHVTDWSESTFISETYLGEKLDRTTALAYPNLELVFHIADHIIEELPHVKMYFSEIKTKAHLHPVWREKADFLIGSKIPDSNHQAAIHEQLWAHQVVNNTFEICCIPFFIYDLSLGDVVETDKGYLVTRVTKPSGHYTFKVWFGDSTSDTIRDEIIDRLTKEEYLYEWYSHDLLAIDFPNEARAAEFSGFLVEKQQLKELVFETGKT